MCIRDRGRTVRFQNDAGRHAVGFEIDDLRSAALHEQALFSQFVHHGLHFIRIKALSRIRIETNIEQIINFLYVFQREFFEPMKEFQTFRIPLFDFLKVRTGFVVVFGMYLRLAVETDVQLIQSPNPALFHGISIPPTLIGGNEFPELRAVVAEMIDSYRLIAEKIENTIERPCLLYTSRCV